MIDKALTTIVSKLKSKMGLEGGKLNYLQVGTDQLGKILCSVSHIMMEREQTPTRAIETDAGNMLKFRLNFSANFEASAYPEGLRHLSTILNYLFENPVLDAQNSPALPAEISKIMLTQIASDNNEESLPMIAFEVRMIILTP
ncbi:MAG: hypothetical protein AB8H47_03370 [Bacteroidia bacterium]